MSNIVNIRRQWNDYKIAQVELSKLENPHWSLVSGGVKAFSPQPFMYAYVWCTDIVGDIAHSCGHGECPHHIKVVIVKADNAKDIYQAISNMAGPKPSVIHYKPDADALSIVDALINNGKHHAVEEKSQGLYVINMQKVFNPKHESVSKLTMARRSKRLKIKILNLMEKHSNFKLVKHRNMLAYKYSELK